MNRERGTGNGECPKGGISKGNGESARVKWGNPSKSVGESLTKWGIYDRVWGINL